MCVSVSGLPQTAWSRSPAFPLLGCVPLPGSVSMKATAEKWGVNILLVFLQELYISIQWSVMTIFHICFVIQSRCPFGGDAIRRVVTRVMKTVHSGGQWDCIANILTLILCCKVLFICPCVQNYFSYSSSGKKNCSLPCGSWKFGTTHVNPSLFMTM